MKTKLKSMLYGIYQTKALCNNLDVSFAMDEIRLAVENSTKSELSGTATHSNVKILQLSSSALGEDCCPMVYIEQSSS